MKSIFKTALFTALVGGTALVSVAGTAAAGGFAVREQSAEGQGSSFAGIAAGGSDLSSMFFNPATITLFEGVQAEGNAALIFPFSKAKNALNHAVPGGPSLPPGFLGGTNTGNIGKIALVPSNYASYQLSDNLFVGFSANSPFGLVTKNKASSASSFQGIKSDLLTLQAGPIVGYKFNDMFAVAASVRGVYSSVELTSQLAPGLTAKLSGKDFGINYSVGVLFSPTETTRIGIGYNSATKLKYKGDLEFNVIIPKSAVSAKLETPGTLNVGLRQELGDFAVLLGFEWADWSTMRNLRVIDSGTGATSTFTDFSWKDSFYYSIGGEYKLSEATTLRAGFAFEDSPVPDATRGSRVPDADRYWLSIGASHQVNDKFRVSLGYTHIFVKDGKVDVDPTAFAPVGLRATYKQSVDIISVSGTYKLY